jgi:hypothetical protein
MPRCVLDHRRIDGVLGGRALVPGIVVAGPKRHRGGDDNKASEAEYGHSERV